MAATLEELTEDALVRILTEPKNALAKQYKKLFELDGVQLKFTPEALAAIARQALKQNAGAEAFARFSKVRCSISCTTSPVRITSRKSS